jgi:hypothetical protein
MTVTRTPAVSLDTVQCFKCGGRHFYKNKRTGWRCTNNKPVSADQKLDSRKPVSPKPVAVAAAWSVSHLQNAASRSYSVAASKKVDDSLAKWQQSVDKDLRCIKIDMVNALITLDGIIIFLKSQHAHLKPEGPCLCLNVLPEPLGRAACDAPDLFSPEKPKGSLSASASVSSGAAAESKMDTQPVQSSLVKESSSSASGSSSAKPAPVSKPAASASVAISSSVSESAKEIKRLIDNAASALGVAPFQESKRSSPSAPSSSSFSAVQLSTEEAKAAFVVGIKRDSASLPPIAESDQDKSKRALKRQRQALNRARATASDFF